MGLGKPGNDVLWWGRRAQPKKGTIAALWEDNFDGIVHALDPVIFRNFLAQPPRFRADDVVYPGIERVAFAENFDAEAELLEFAAFASDLLLHDKTGKADAPERKVRSTVSFQAHE